MIDEHKINEEGCEYKFKAVITGKVYGISYLDAVENLFIPGMTTEIIKVKLKDIDLIKEK